LRHGTNEPKSLKKNLGSSYSYLFSLVLGKQKIIKKIRTRMLELTVSIKRQLDE